MKPVTKPGEYGTLYRYVVTYTDKSDPCCPEMTWHCWAYSLEHAEDKFYANDDSWTIVNLRRLVEGIDQHRVPRHAPRAT